MGGFPVVETYYWGHKVVDGKALLQTSQVAVRSRCATDRREQEQESVGAYISPTPPPPPLDSEPARQELSMLPGVSSCSGNTYS